MHELVKQALLKNIGSGVVQGFKQIGSTFSPAINAGKTRYGMMAPNHGRLAAIGGGLETGVRELGRQFKGMGTAGKVLGGAGLGIGAYMLGNHIMSNVGQGTLGGIATGLAPLALGAAGAYGMKYLGHRPNSQVSVRSTPANTPPGQLRYPEKYKPAPPPSAMPPKVAHFLEKSSNALHKRIMAALKARHKTIKNRSKLGMR